MNTLLLIDGENFRKALGVVFKSAERQSPAWHEYDFKGLFDKVLTGLEISHRTFYFARLKMHPSTEEKSKKLIEEQRLLKTHLEKQGFEVVLAGMVRGQIIDGPWFKGGSHLIFKEKGVDVRIAVDMVASSCDKTATSIVLGSSDSDMQPAIHETKRRGVQCIYLGFEDRPNQGISASADKTILIRNSEVLSFSPATLPLL